MYPKVRSFKTRRKKMTLETTLSFWGADAPNNLKILAQTRLKGVTGFNIHSWEELVVGSASISFWVCSYWSSNFNTFLDPVDAHIKVEGGLEVRGQEAVDLLDKIKKDLIQRSERQAREVKIPRLRAALEE
ncbi:MAG: hypothetical protein WCK91_02670 [bacterium]